MPLPLRDSRRPPLRRRLVFVHGDALLCCALLQQLISCTTLGHSPRVCDIHPTVRRPPISQPAHAQFTHISGSHLLRADQQRDITPVLVHLSSTTISTVFCAPNPFLDHALASVTFLAPSTTEQTTIQRAVLLSHSSGPVAPPAPRLSGFSHPFLTLPFPPPLLAPAPLPAGRARPACSTWTQTTVLRTRRSTLIMRSARSSRRSHCPRLISPSTRWRMEHK